MSEDTHEPGFWICLRLDAKRHGSWTAALFNLGFWAVLHYRVARSLHRAHADLPARLVQAVGHLFTGAEISRRASIGPGLGIFHPHGILIGPGARIGIECNVHQGSSITPDTWMPGEAAAYPVLEDRVYVGAGARVLGGVRVHHDARVAPNSVVLRDVPVNATALGVPARILDHAFRHQGG